MRAAQRARPRAGALVVLGVALLLSPSVLGTGTSAPWMAWTREVVEGTDAFASYPQIALLPNGSPVVAHRQEGGAQLVSRVGGVWLAEPLGGYDQGGVATDEAGAIHVSLRNGSQLVYGKKVGPDWTLVPFPTLAEVFQHPIVASPSGQPHIGFRLGQSIYYATLDVNTGTPVVESVDTRGLSSVTTGISIALDSRGVPRMAYGVTAGSGWDLIFASRNPDGTWTRETALVRCGLHTSMAMAGDTPHMSCQDETRGLIWVTRNASGWIYELVDSTGAGPFAQPTAKVGRYTDIAVGLDERPHISYWVVYRCGQCVLEPGQLHYATKSATTWSRETVDKIGQSNGDDSSIDVDAGGRPRIAYNLAELAALPLAPMAPADILYAEPLSPVKLPLT